MAKRRNIAMHTGKEKEHHPDVRSFSPHLYIAGYPLEAIVPWHFLVAHT